jgi:hypothetical protein
VLAGGYARQVLPDGPSKAARDSAAGLNAAIARLNGDGGDMPRICPPATGSAMNVDLLETMAIGEILSGPTTDPVGLTAAVRAALTHRGLSVQQDGQPATDPVEAAHIVTDALRTVVGRRLPILPRMGVVGQSIRAACIVCRSPHL